MKANTVARKQVDRFSYKVPIFCLKNTTVSSVHTTDSRVQKIGKSFPQLFPGPHFLLIKKYIRWSAFQNTIPARSGDTFFISLYLKSSPFSKDASPCTNEDNHSYFYCHEQVRYSARISSD